MESCPQKKSTCKKAFDRPFEWILVENRKNRMAKTMHKTQLQDGERHIHIKELNGIVFRTGR